MEWVETTAKTVEAAKDIALDQLGVAEDDAEFEVLEEPRAGLFGRVRGQARVRARVRPTQPRPKLDRRDRRRRSDKGSKAAAPSTDPSDQPGGSEGAPAPRVRRGTGSRRPVVEAEPVTAEPATAEENGEASDPASVEAAAATPRRSRNGHGRGRASGDGQPSRQRGRDTGSQHEEQQMSEVEVGQVGQEAVRFVEGVLSAFGLAGTVELVSEGDELEVRVSGDNLGLLVGPRGTTLQALQDLTRVAAQRRLGDRETRLRVDVGGYRERRRVALSRFAQQVADEVVASGQARALEPMSSADRKVIHDVLTTVEAVVTHSEGDDPNRRVIIAPANG